MKLPFSIFNAFAYFNFMWGASILLDIFLSNSLVQIMIFISIACIPVLIFKKMWLTDIAESSGIVCISLEILYAFPSTGTIRQQLIGYCYLILGAKRLIFCLHQVITEQWTIEKPELSRYEQTQSEALTLNRQADIMTLCTLNCTVYLTPALVISLSSVPEFYENSFQICLLEIVLYCIFILTVFLEINADCVKYQWSKQLSKNDKNKKVCTIRPWDSCRHPNYFFHWVSWTSLSFLSLHNLFFFYSETSPFLIYFFAVQVLLIPIFMYERLVYWTGASSQEFYSLKKRPDYEQYIQNVPCFFPKQLQHLNLKLKSQQNKVKEASEEITNNRQAKTK